MEKVKRAMWSAFKVTKKLQNSKGRFRMKKKSFSLLSQKASLKQIKERTSGGTEDTLDDMEGFSVDDLDVDDEFEPVDVQVSGWWIL